MSKQEELIEQKKKELMAKLANQTKSSQPSATPSASATAQTAKPTVLRPGGLGKRPNW